MRHRIAVLAALVFLYAAGVFAQSVAGLGAISGTVRDATGSAVPDAQVIVSNVETGNSFRAGELAPEIVDASFR